ncbi:MAG: deoxynucleotide monophosphate kinase family protein [Arthrobacter sp.]
MIVIALTGRSRAGKDSVADVLVAEHGFTKMSFAAPIKRMLANLDPIVGYDYVRDCWCGGEDCAPSFDQIRLSDLYDMGYTDETIKESQWADEVRDLWQRFGTEVIRGEVPEFWVDLAMQDIFKSGTDRIVLTDCRFPNEAEAVYNLNGPFFANGELTFSPVKASVWEVSRPDLIEDGDTHESESHAGLLEEEIQIINSGTLEDLSAPVAVALKYVTEESFTGQGLLWESVTGGSNE